MLNGGRSSSGGGWTDDALLDAKRRKLQAEVLYAAT
jgi:hypothetical protein